MWALPRSGEGPGDGVAATPRRAELSSGDPVAGSLAGFAVSFQVRLQNAIVRPLEHSMHQQKRPRGAGRALSTGRYSSFQHLYTRVHRPSLLPIPASYNRLLSPRTPACRGLGAELPMRWGIN